MDGFLCYSNWYSNNFVCLASHPPNTIDIFQKFNRSSVYSYLFLVIWCHLDVLGASTARVWDFIDSGCGARTRIPNLLEPGRIRKNQEDKRDQKHPEKHVFTLSLSHLPVSVSPFPSHLLNHIIPRPILITMQLASVNGLGHIWKQHCESILLEQ